VNGAAEIQMAERMIKMYNWPAHHFAVLYWVMERASGQMLDVL